MSHRSHQTVQLTRGKHTSPEGGVCVMELASMLAGEPFSDHPMSVCPVVASYLRSLNDVLDDERRQELYRYASEAVGTRDSEAVRRARIERCRRAVGLIHVRRARLRRFLGESAPQGPEDSLVDLERFTMHVVRSLSRTGPGWHRRAVGLVDELIATTAGDAHPAATGAESRRSVDPVLTA